MNSKQRKTLAAIFADPVSGTILWADIERLFSLNGVLATFHRPHPEPTTDKGAVKSVRRFLENAGVRP